MEYAQLVERFQNVYGPGSPRIFKSAARVNLIGEHTDYNGGYVFPAALSMRSACLVRERTDGKINMASTSCEHEVHTDIESLRDCRRLPWGNYQAGMLYLMQKEGYAIGGMDMLYDETVPHGGGLSASAAIELATGIAAATLSAERAGTPVDRVALAILGRRDENEYIGMNCGIMDQFASAMGRKGQAMLLDCAKISCEYAPVELERHGVSLAIINTNKPHNLVKSAYNERRASCEDALSDLQKQLPVKNLCELKPQEFADCKKYIKNDESRLRAQHAIEENARTLEAYAALRAGELERFGELLYDSHESLRYKYEVTGPELDALVDAARASAGVLGARMTGGGFGGCAIALVKTSALDDFKARVAREYTKATSLTPSFYLADISDGAKEVLL